MVFFNTFSLIKKQDSTLDFHSIWILYSNIELKLFWNWYWIWIKFQWFIQKKINILMIDEKSIIMKRVLITQLT